MLSQKTKNNQNFFNAITVKKSYLPAALASSTAISFAVSVIVFTQIEKLAIIITLPFILAVLLCMFLVLAASVFFVFLYCQRIEKYLSADLLETKNNQEAIRLLDDSVKKIKSVYHSAPELSQNSAEFYICYKKLGIKNLSTILDLTNRIYLWVYFILFCQDTFDIPENNDPERTYNDILQFVEERLKASPENRLFLSYAATGESIRFHLISGWMPTLETKNGDFLVGIHKGEAALGISAMLLYICCMAGMNLRKIYYESGKAKNEYETSQITLKQKRFDLFFKNYDNLSIELKYKFDQDMDLFLKETVGNEEISAVKIKSGYTKYDI